VLLSYSLLRVINLAPSYVFLALRCMSFLYSPQALRGWLVQVVVIFAWAVDDATTPLIQLMCTNSLIPLVMIYPLLAPLHGTLGWL